MLLALAAEAMRAGEGSANADAGARRDFGAEHRFHWFVMKTTRSQLRPVMLRVLPWRADDAIALPAVAERQGNRFLDEAVLLEGARCSERDVAGGRVDMVDPGEDQLHRAAFRADDQIDAARIAMHALLELAHHQDQEHDGADAKREQNEAERGVQRPRAQVARGEGREVHRAPSSRRSLNLPFTRASCVATTRVAPWRAACSASRSTTVA